MLGNHHSTTSTQMSDVARNVIIIGKNHFSPSQCSIGTLIKTSYSTHNKISFRLNGKGQSLTFTYSISNPDKVVKFFSIKICNI